MGLFKLSLILVIAFMTLVSFHHLSTAQNSPQDFLNAHNAARTRVGVGPIAWDVTVAAYAQNYANQRAKRCEMKHSSGPYGENLAKGTSNLTGIDAVNMWIGERSFYDHDSNTCKGDECGHYTQVVWSNSVKLGCARVKCRDGWWFITCNYDPPGNYVGESPY